MSWIPNTARTAAPQVSGSTQTAKPASGSALRLILGRWELTELMTQGDLTCVARATPTGGASGDSPANLSQQEPSLHAEDGVAYVAKYAAQIAGRVSSAARRCITRETQLLNTLDHPHIVPVLDAASDEPLPYLIMPDVGRRNLREFLTTERGCGSLDVIWLMRQASEGLAYLHQAGWCHVDFKPSNLVVDDTGKLTLVDFAFAQRDSEAASKQLWCGSSIYLPPERRRAPELIRSSCDIYAWGVTLLESLLTTVPRASLPQSDIGWRKLGRWLPLRRQQRVDGLSSLLPELPRAFWTLLETCLASVPERRPTAAELLAQLRRWEIMLWSS